MRDISKNINKRLPFEGRFALADITDFSSGDLDYLNEAEKKELESFGNIRRQREYVTSRMALNRMAQQLGVPDLKVLKDELGQPYGLANPQKFHVSIAHTDEEVFCGISEHRAIGIDMEPVTREVTERLHHRILHPDEGDVESEIEAIRLWTMKEAYIKLRGQGLRLNMNQVQLKQLEDGFYIELNDEKRAKICSFQSGNNWLAIAFFQ